MKKAFLYSLALCCLLVACRKDVDQLTTNEQIDQPTQMDAVTIHLNLHSQGEPIEDVEIKVYASDTIPLNTYMTDEDGETDVTVVFSILNTDELFIIATHDEYAAALREIRPEHLDLDQIDVALVAKESLPFDIEQTDPMDLIAQSNIILSGNVSDSIGYPGSAIISVVDDFVNPNFSNTTTTNSFGDYELLVPANSDLHLIAFTTDCNEYLSIWNQNYNNLPFENVAIQSSDVVLDFENSTRLVPAAVTFTALDCNGLMIPYATFSINGNSSDPISGIPYVCDANGSFTFQNEMYCSYDHVLLDIDNPNDPLVGAQHNMLINNIVMALGDIMLCEQTVENFFTVSGFGGQQLNLTDVGVLQNTANNFQVTAFESNGTIYELSIFNAYGSANGLFEIYNADFSINLTGTMNFDDFSIYNGILQGDYVSDMYDLITEQNYGEVSGSVYVEL